MNIRKIRGIVVAMIVFLLAIIGVSKAKNFFLAKDAVASEGEVKEELTVNFDELLLGKAYPEVSREFLDSSMPNRNRERVEAAGFSTALTMPFSETQQEDGASYPDETIKRWWSQELKEEILRNPVHGMAVMKSIAELKFSDGLHHGHSMDRIAEDFLLQLLAPPSFDGFVRITSPVLLLSLRERHGQRG